MWLWEFVPITGALSRRDVIKRAYLSEIYYTPPHLKRTPGFKIVPFLALSGELAKGYKSLGRYR